MDGHRAFEGTVTRAWRHPLSDGSGDIAVFQVAGEQERVFWTGEHWLPMLAAAREREARVHVSAAAPREGGLGVLLEALVITWV